MDFPSVTLCNEYGLDTGEYMRNILNNLEYGKGNNIDMKIKQGFKGFLVDLISNPEKQHASSNDYYKFSEEWLRFALRAEI